MGAGPDFRSQEGLATGGKGSRPVQIAFATDPKTMNEFRGIFTPVTDGS